MCQYCMSSTGQDSPRPGLRGRGCIISLIITNIVSAQCSCERQYRMWWEIVRGRLLLFGGAWERVSKEVISLRGAD